MILDPVLSSPLRYRYRYRLSFYSLSLSLSSSLGSRRSETPYPPRSINPCSRSSQQRASHGRWNIHSRPRNNTNTCCTQNSCRASSSFASLPRVCSTTTPSPIDPLTPFRFAPISTHPRDVRVHVRLSSGCPFNLLDNGTMQVWDSIPSAKHRNRVMKTAEARRDEDSSRYVKAWAGRGRKKGEVAQGQDACGGEMAGFVIRDNSLPVAEAAGNGVTTPCEAQGGGRLKRVCILDEG